MTPKPSEEDKIEEEMINEESKRREKEQVGAEKGVAATEIVEEMEHAFIDYAMSVIVDRALPSVEDGLKPVHRRILYAMHSLGLDPSKPTMKCARIVGECFAKGTLVLTEKGIAPIESIGRGDIVYTQNGKNIVKELYEMPEKDLIKLTLQNGVNVTATPSQKIKIINKNLSFEWKEAKEISKNDYVVMRAEYPQIGELSYLGDLNNKKIYFNENIAYLIGQLLSDGWVEKGNKRGYSLRCGFCSSSNSVINHIAIILKNEFDYAPTIEERNYELASGGQILVKKMYTIRINSSMLNEFIVNSFSLQGARAHNKQIPACVFSSPKNVIYSFISGLIDGDGHLSSNRNSIVYVSVSEKLIDRLQILLQYLGIVSQRYKQNVKEGGTIFGKQIKSNYPPFSLEISGRFALALAEKLRLQEEKKAKRARELNNASIKTSSFDVIPYLGNTIFHGLSERHIGGGWYEDKDCNKFRAGIKYKNGTKIRYSKDLREKHLGKVQLVNWGIDKKLERLGLPVNKLVKEILDNDLFFLRVKDIEKQSPEKTYDIEVEDNHEFITNGIVVHNCMGKYHPHGNIAIYDALVRMAQDFSLRYPLVHGQGNFGSVDGDSAAADRYTEAKMSKISGELLEDIEKKTVKTRPNFDNSLEEPETLPAKIPNLLLNGASGIAVGMATNIPPHNLTEVSDAIIEYINKPEITIDDLSEIVKGPDFPTGGIIMGSGIKDMYKVGKGKIIIRAKTTIEEDKKGRSSIVVTEIPYMVNKSDLVKTIAKLATEKKLPDIYDLRDESSKGKVRIVIELKKDVDPKYTLNKLYTLTNLQTSFDANMLALVGKQPRVLNLKEIITEYVKYRQLIVRNRSKFDLRKAEDRLEIVLGLLIAQKNIDAIVEFIKKSENTQTAHEGLMRKFELTDRQAKAVLEIKLQQLTKLETGKLKEEENKLKEEIDILKRILGDEKEILKVIKKEVQEVKSKYGDERRTRILKRVEEITEKDLVEKKDVVVMLTNGGYIKRVDVTDYREQRRGGAGVSGQDLKEEDFVRKMITCSTHDYLLFFTSRGRIFWLKANDIPASERQSKGKALINVIDMHDEIISNVMAIRNFNLGYLMFATKKGQVKKLPLKDVSKPRSTGVRIMNLPPDNSDSIINVRHVSNAQEVLLITKKGQAIRFNSDEVRPMGRSSYGVKGIELDKNDEVVSIEAMPLDGKTTILTVSSKGFGKRTALEEYRKTARAGKGVINLATSDKTGDVIGSLSVNDKDSVIITTTKGMVLRITMRDLRVMGRATQGVHVVRLKEGDKLADIVKVPVAEGIPSSPEGSQKVLEV